MAFGRLLGTMTPQEMASEVAREKQSHQGVLLRSDPVNAPPSAHISADYEEFKPETFKGYTVSFSEEPGVTYGPFKTEAEALFLAHHRAEKVYTMSSVDHYKQDLRVALKFN